jgi:S-methylmethionine-dependent homocysteine/selenocysteine methylase
MTAPAAAEYHYPQIAAFAGTEADMVSTFTLNYTEEAIGIALAARAADMPCALTFTVETDGRLPTGDPLQRAIELTDEATHGYPAYYMINCAHPTHVMTGMEPPAPWRERVPGVRAIASSTSHAELNEATTLDEGDPADFGALHAALKLQFPQLCVIGGCCGTDHRRIESASRVLIP